MMAGPERQDVLREARIVQHRRQSREQGPPRSVASLRNEVLKSMAPLRDGIFYDAAAMALLNEFEDALRRVWEQDARQQVLQRAVDTMQATIASLDTGGLL